MFCPKCGTKIKNGAMFCNECGTEIANRQETMQQNSGMNHNSQVNNKSKTETKVNKQSIGLVVGVVLICIGLVMGDVIPYFFWCVHIGTVIMFYTKEK